MFIEYGITAFRRFVLDTLAKLDEQDRENGLSATQGQSQHVYQSVGSLSNSSNERNKHVASPYARVSPWARYKSLFLNFPNSIDPCSSKFCRHKPTNGSDNAAEAMRIIEGLKNKPFASIYMQGRESPHLEASPSASLTASRWEATSHNWWFD